MSFLGTDEQEHPRITLAVQWLIAINVAIYFLQLTVVRPSDVANALAFKLPDLTDRPWTIFTYMFVHAGFWHLALNMYTLWLFGPRVEREWGAKSFSFYYVLCGLGGWLFDILFSRSGYLLGASAAIYGVMLAYAMRWPDDEMVLFPFVFISIKVKWLVVLLVGFNLALGLWSAGAGSSEIAYFAHLGGFVFGWLYLRASSAPGIDRLRHRISRVPDEPEGSPPQAIPHSPPRARERPEIDEIVARSNAAVANKQGKRQSPLLPLSRRFGKKKTEELNRVLDKISAKGIESLTPEERVLLEEMSKRLRNS
ncbi:MAG TPA: rhomboid family intramembrane serine protease [Gemmatimonadaceae bacterium]|nr:rhomboid family intramembrane serine protease [Gemmatimonadaceae bacterium]